jgi:CSLREA domain-containing protein
VTRRIPHLLSLAMLALALTATPASAAMITVTTTADENGTGAGCSLREAIRSANENSAVGGCVSGSAGLDSVVLPSGTYSLSIGPAGDDLGQSGDLDVLEELTINGGGTPSTIINGAQLDRVFDVLATAMTVTITDITITGGKTETDQNGGGIDVDSSTLRLERVHLTGNHADNFGGAIHDNEGILLISDGAITNNVALDDSGGIDHIDGSPLTPSVLTNVTVSGNSSGTATTEGWGGGIGASNPMTLNTVTIVGNTVVDAGGSDYGGGGLAAPNPPSPVTISNSLIAGNTAPTGPDCYLTVNSGGYNLVGNGTDCAIAPGPGDQIGTGAAPIDPLVGPLADNGGPTPTHALLKGSPAINGGNPAAPGSGGSACAANDQRGLARNCDIGAYELVFCQKVAVNRIGTSGKDNLKGTPGPDGMLGFGGNDRLAGKAGKDGLCGGPGKDTLKGGGGKDRLDGGPGKDLCVGQAGRDKARKCEREKTI